MTQWVRWDGTSLLPVWDSDSDSDGEGEGEGSSSGNGTAVITELYDHRNETYRQPLDTQPNSYQTPIYPTDFDAGENANVAADPALEPVVQALSRILRAQFHG